MDGPWVRVQLFLLTVCDIVIRLVDWFKVVRRPPMILDMEIMLLSQFL